MRNKDFDKQNRIKEAMIRLILRDGIDGTSMSKIAKEAGVSPATIYVCYESKEDMLSEVFREYAVRSYDYLILAVRVSSNPEESVTVTPEVVRSEMEVRPNQYGRDIARAETGSCYRPGLDKRGRRYPLYRNHAHGGKRQAYHHRPAGRLVTALASLLTGRSVDPHIAMTGEVALRGAVTPVGGLPEKLMAAERAGITKVFIPKENMLDLKGVAREVKDKIEIVPVSKVTEILAETGAIGRGSSMWFR